jgi:hypothetical protein
MDRNMGNPRPGAPHTAHHETQGRGAMGSFERQTHEQATHHAKVHDAQAGALRSKAESVSGSYLVVRALSARAARVRRCEKTR